MLSFNSSTVEERSKAKFMTRKRSTLLRLKSVKLMTDTHWVVTLRTKACTNCWSFTDSKPMRSEISAPFLRQSSRSKLILTGTKLQTDLSPTMRKPRRHWHSSSVAPSKMITGKVGASSSKALAIPSLEDTKAHGRPQLTRKRVNSFSSLQDASLQKSNDSSKTDQ